MRGGGNGASCPRSLGVRRRSQTNPARLTNPGG
jgi:hypothetical protein